MQIDMSRRSGWTAVRGILSMAVTAAWATLGCGDAVADRYPGALPDHRVARGSKGIAEAWLADRTGRYRHFVLGANYEAGSLYARLADGRIVKLTLEQHSVFEDRQPRLADLDGDGRDEIVVVRSRLDRGASVAVVAVVGDKLAIVAETPPTGRPNTWRNPAAIVDLDGDGRPEILEVQMPHVLGRLRVWALQPGKEMRLRQIAELDDVSNHMAGSAALALSAVTDFDGDGRPDLIIPSLDRRAIRVISFASGPRETARRPLPSPAVGDFRLERRAGKPLVVIDLGSGKSYEMTP